MYMSGFKMVVDMCNVLVMSASHRSLFFFFALLFVI